MHEESLTKDTKRVFKALNRFPFIKDFYLAGGSALSIYFGHRFSIDLDWFSDNFSCDTYFIKNLSEFGKLNIDNQSEKTFNGSLDGVRVSFFEYPYLLIAPKIKYGNIYLASKQDIAAMKLDAIATRGSYKDFVDIYFLLQEYTIEEILGFLRKKFTGLEYNEMHLLKSLTYFEDVKKSEMPEMIIKVEWEEIKKELIMVVEKYLKSL